MEKRMLRVEEVSEYIGIAPKTIRNKLANGTFPIAARRIGRCVRFDRRDVDKYLDGLKKIN